MSDPELAAVVLAGGLSTRWGRDKALAPWRGRRLLDHVVERLPDERASTVLVIRAEQDGTAWPAERIVHDDPGLPAGPLRGVIAGLEACETARAWVVACDLPLIHAGLLRFLAGVAAPDRPAVIPVWEGRPQPLVGVYRADTADALRATLAAGEHSLIDALVAADVLLVAEEECRRYDPRGESFLNLNRPDQAADLAERLAAEAGEDT